MEDKLAKLRGGVTLVKVEDRKIVEEIYTEKVSQWRKRKRMFKDLWDAITENSPKDLKEFKVFSMFYLHFTSSKHMHLPWQAFFTNVYVLQEELGIEYDEDVDVNLQSFCDLLQHDKKRARCR